MDPHFTDRSPTMNLGETNRGAFFAGPTHRFWRLKCHEPFIHVHSDQQDGLLPLNLLCNLILYIYTYSMYTCVYIICSMSETTETVGPARGRVTRWTLPVSAVSISINSAPASRCSPKLVPRLRCGVSRGSMFWGFVTKDVTEAENMGCEMM